MTIVDGDHGTRVPGAVVKLWNRQARTDRQGVAEIVVPGRRNLNVTVGASGFSTRTVLARFEDRRKVTLRVFRPDLQWPIYGATVARSQSRPIRLRPPFNTVWASGSAG